MPPGSPPPDAPGTLRDPQVLADGFATRLDDPRDATVVAADTAVAVTDLDAVTASTETWPSQPTPAHMGPARTTAIDMHTAADVVSAHPSSSSSPGRPHNTGGTLAVLSASNPGAVTDDAQPPPVELRDGRVKNPIPTKLQKRASEKDGNFSVMHIDGRTRQSPMDERDLAAKRSSEATQAAAMDAYKKGYQSLKRGHYAWRPPNQEQQPSGMSTSVPPPSQSSSQYGPPNPYLMPSPGQTPPFPAGPAPDVVKAEQSRLLTFLRSVHPILVVDQLCKAVAYFGGVPGAPPPADGRGFPTSEHGYGTGSLIVGWLSEIFPPADLTKPPFSTFAGGDMSLGDLSGRGAALGAGNAASTDAHNGGVPVKRSRGRPKGSKSSKTRKDKGIKKGQRVAADGQSNPNAASAPTGSESQLDPDASIQSTPGPRKRGRPKGSKNRPKPPVTDMAQDQDDSQGTVLGMPASSVHSTPGGPAANGANAPYQGSYLQGLGSSAPGSLAAETTLSQHAQNWSDPPTATLRHDGLDSGLPTLDMSRKRTLDQQQQQPPMRRDSQSKRRRVSRDAHQAMVTAGMGSQSPVPGASPVPSAVGMSNGPTSGTSTGFGSQSPVGNIALQGSGPGTQRPFQPPPPHPGQHQQYQQQTPTANTQYYTQQPPPPPQSPHLNQFAQPQQPGGQTPVSFSGNGSSPHPPTAAGNPSAPATAMTSASPPDVGYPSYNNNDLINMQYAMSTGRQQPVPTTEFPGQPSQLQGALAESQMQDRIYNAFGRR